VNLARILGDAFAAHAARPALVGETGTITYEELGRRADAAATLLVERGVEPGDRVALMLPNSPAFVAATLATWKLGAILVPLNGLLAPLEVEARLDASTPEVFLRDEAELRTAGEPVMEPVERASADPAVILFTSGTPAGRGEERS
jgi:acyl-coenzyme A synthetase/AMP-(fatty) acid ligase